MMIDSWRVRRATPADEDAVVELMSDAERMVLHASWAEVRSALGVQIVYLVESEGRPVCVCGTVVGPRTVAQIRAFALRDGWPLLDALATLLPYVREALSDQEVETLAFVGQQPWLLEGLKASGFRQADAILALQTTTLVSPDAGSLQVTVRPATPLDLPDVLAIDEAALAPLWHNTAESLSTFLESCAYFCVAELDGQLVGYQCLHLTGRHAHLARIAVHPDYQGRRIGVRLLDEAFRFLRQQRVYGVTLNTQESNHRARRLYEWFGFRVLGQEAQVVLCACSAARTRV